MAPDLRRLCVDAGARADVGEAAWGALPEQLREHYRARFAVGFDAILSVLAEAVEGLRQEPEWVGDEGERILDVSAKAGNRVVDAVLALLADVQGDGDA